MVDSNLTPEYSGIQDEYPTTSGDIDECPSVDVRSTSTRKQFAVGRDSRHRCVSDVYDQDSPLVNPDNGGCELNQETDHLLNNHQRSNTLNTGNSYETTDKGHCHDGSNQAGVDKKARNKLLIAIIFCLLFMLAEAIGGFLSGSLAIISDSAHLLTDFASFLISLLAIYLGTRPATKRLSFGWYRAEILGALLSILLLWVVTGILVYTAAQRVISDDYDIDAKIMLIVAAVGVVFNLILGSVLHQHSHSHGSHSHGSHSHSSSGEINASHSSYGAIEGSNERKHGSDINVTAAFVHVIGDLLQSIGVLISAFIIYFKPEYKIADPICTFLFSVFVLITTATVMRDIIVVLMEGTPRSMNFLEVRNTLMDLPGVKDIHNLRVWSLTLSKTALSVHIAIESDCDPLQLIKNASFTIKSKYGITETTMQIEEYVDEMLDCTKCQHLKD